MERKETTYTLKKVIESERATVRVFSPVLTEEEREKRFEQIKNAAARLLIAAGQ